MSFSQEVADVQETGQSLLNPVSSDQLAALTRQWTIADRELAQTVTVLGQAVEGARQNLRVRSLNPSSERAAGKAASPTDATRLLEQTHRALSAAVEANASAANEVVAATEAADTVLDEMGDVGVARIAIIVVAVLLAVLIVRSIING